MTTQQIIYQNFIKPSRFPPGYLFGIVRTILYIIIAISFWYTLYQVINKNLHRTILIPFGINLLANFIFTYLQFWLKRYDLALIDCIIILWTIIWIIFLMWNKIRRVSYAQIPYLLRVCFATILATYIYVLN